MGKVKSVAFFPLSLFKMPGDTIQLHVFESRYQQLIQEILNNEMEYFGIPASLADGRHAQFGSLARLRKVDRHYPDGRLDIQVEIIDLFEILSFEQQLGNKLYAGGDIKRLNFRARPIKNHQLEFQFQELCTQYPGIIQGKLSEVLTDSQLLRMLPVGDDIRLAYAKLPSISHVQDAYLIYQLKRIFLLAKQEANMQKGICYN